MKKKSFFVCSLLSLFCHIVIVLFLVTLVKFTLNKKKPDNNLVIEVDVTDELIHKIETPIENNIDTPSHSSQEIVLIDKKKVKIKKKIIINKGIKKPTVKIQQDFSNLYKNSNGQKSFKTIGNSQNNKGVFEKRLAKFGQKGGYNNSIIQATLIWNNKDDLDLEAVLPTKRAINFLKRSYGGGRLDVDKNVAGKTLVEDPVENIFWKEHPANGQYIFYLTYPRLSFKKNNLAYEFRLKAGRYLYYFRGKVNDRSNRYLLAIIKVVSDEITLTRGRPYKKKYLLKNEINFAKIDTEEIKIQFD